MTVLGICKLCQQEGELQSSHFLPAWLYRLCRDDENNKNPIAISAGIAKQTSNESRDYVFCRNCEERLNVRGEEWLHTRAASSAGFPIQEAIKNSTPLIAKEDIAVYAGAQIPDLDMDQLAYFGLSIFWRSSVHAWPNPSNLFRKMLGISLGPYEEPVRQFLLDKGPFPSTAAILVSVWPYTDPSPPVVFHTPVSTRNRTFHCHQFYIPGIDFKFVAGKALPEAFRHMCAQSSPQRAIISSTLGADAITNMFTTDIGKSVPSGKLVNRPQRR